MKKIITMFFVFFISFLGYANTAEELYENALIYEKEDKLFYALATVYDAYACDSDNSFYEEEVLRLADIIKSGNFNKPDMDDFDLHDRWKLFLQEVEIYFSEKIPSKIIIGKFLKGEVNYETRITEYKVHIGSEKTVKFNYLIGKIVFPGYKKVRKSSWKDMPFIYENGGPFQLYYRYLGSAFFSILGYDSHGEDTYYLYFDYEKFYKQYKVLLTSYNNWSYNLNTGISSNDYQNPSPIFGTYNEINFIMEYNIVDIENNNIILSGISNRITSYSPNSDFYDITFKANQEMSKKIDNGEVKIIPTKLKLLYGYNHSDKIPRPTIDVDVEQIKIVYD